MGPVETAEDGNTPVSNVKKPVNEETEAALRAAFEKFDTNGDGAIGKDEFVFLLKNTGGGLGEAEIERLFTEADKNVDGVLNWNEFIGWICGGTDSGAMKMSKLGDLSFRQLKKMESSEENAFVRGREVADRVLQFLKSKYPNEVGSKEQTEKARNLKRLEKEQKSDGGSQSQPAGGRGSTLEVVGSDGYDGPHLSFPMTVEQAKDLNEHYLRNGTRKPLHAKYVTELVTRFTKVYGQMWESSVVMVDKPTESGAKLIVVGDTHGQLADVLYIFHVLGPPSKNNIYLFNGDIADRGDTAVEIFCLLFAYFLAEPGCILINRGNHENEDMNALEAESGGGFLDEVLAKYGVRMYKRFVTMMKQLQLGTVIGDEVFVVHGGLARVKTLTLDYIRSIDHKSCTTPNPATTVVKEQVFSDLVWSDPMEDAGKYRSDRGVGITFGPDVTEKFCEKNGLRYIIRSHQLPEQQRGFMKHHGGRCITIFSASNYCGDSGNYGAVLVFESEKFPKYAIYEHYAPSLDMMVDLVEQAQGQDWEKAGKEYERREREKLEERRLKKELQKMMLWMVEAKPEIWAHFSDTLNGKAMVDFETWEGVLCEIVGEGCSWDLAWKQWNLGDAKGMVNYQDFLKRFNVVLSKDQYMAFKFKAITAVYESIMNLDMSLSETFELFDKDGDGTVDLKEMKQVLGCFDLGLTPPQLNSLMRALFVDAKEDSKNGVMKIKVEDFLTRFTVVYKQAENSLVHEDEATNSEFRINQEALGKVGKLILSTPIEKCISEMESAVLKIQAVQRGKAAREKDKEKPDKNEKPLSESKSTPAQGGAAKDTGTKGGSSAAEKLSRLFRAIDQSGDGIIDSAEFVTGIRSLPGLDELTLSDGSKVDENRVKALLKNVDKSENGSINYLEFLEAFSFEDSKGEEMADSLAEHILTMLFRHRQAVRVGANFFDDVGIGKVTRLQFEHILEALNHAISRPEKQFMDSQIHLLSETLSVDEGDGPVIPYEDFISSFEVVDSEDPTNVCKTR